MRDFSFILLQAVHSIVLDSFPLLRAALGWEQDFTTYIKRITGYKAPGSNEACLGYCKECSVRDIGNFS